MVVSSMTKRVAACLILGLLAAFALTIRGAEAEVASPSAQSDIHIMQNTPTTSYSGAAELVVDGDEPSGSGKDSSALLRFDLRGIPTNATVSGAKLKLVVKNPSAQTYELYASKKSWVSSNTTWNNYDTGKAWEKPGALGATDRESTVLASLTPSTTGAYSASLNSSGVSKVQSWVTAGVANPGFIISDGVNTDGLSFYSANDATASNRPVLEVTYTVPAPAETRAHGAYSGGYPWNTAALDNYVAKVGTKPALFAWFEDWKDNGNVQNFDCSRLTRLTSQGVTPHITWMPWDRDAGTNQTTYDIKTIGAGNHDAYVRQYAQAAKACGQPFYFRFAHEMNGDWYPWSPGVDGGTAADYVAAWRHVHDIFVSEGVTNAKWVWCPDAGRAISSSLYPGDVYVDWTCLDTYNWGNTKSWSTWRSLYDAFKPGYDAALAIAPAKPLMIGETGSVESGGDKAAWIRQAYADDIPNKLPKVKAVVYADENWAPDDWRVDTSAASLAAYKEAVASAGWSGKMP